MLDKALAGCKYVTGPLSDMEMYNLLVSRMLIFCLGSINNQWKYQCILHTVSSVCNKTVQAES